ncbi:MAG: hypothetical protein HRT57_06035 [Crocinitomicaceae bacterium]|nr:hypothetical protein [Crocinitomicaceae bacterium]
MRLSFLLLITVFFNSGMSFGQLPSNFKKLEGTWKYKEGSGYEVWGIQGNRLIGFTYRITKMGDTTKVEDMSLGKFNNTSVYSFTTYNIVNDSLITKHHVLVGRKRKMIFTKMFQEVGYSIQYKFGFLNKNKLKVIVHNIISDRPVKFTLLRIKE